MAESLLGARPRAAAALVAAFGLLLAIFVPGASATAAPPYETTATLDSVEFASETVTSGSAASLSATWSLPDNPTTPVGVVIPLPPELQGRTDNFPMISDDGETMGHCWVTGTQVYCDIDDAYVEANPVGLHGTVSFRAGVTTEVTETTEKTYDFGDVSATVTVEPQHNTCTVNCEYTGRDYSKWGDYYVGGDDKHYINWGISLKSGPEGALGGQSVTVTDVLQGPQEYIRAEVRATNQVGVSADGTEGPVNWAPLTADQYTGSAVEGVVTVSFTTQEGYFYDVRIFALVTDNGASVDYDNHATIEVEGEQVVEVEGSTQYKGGSATGLGTNIGRFAITKEVTGSGADAAEGITFEGTFEVVTPEGETIPGEFDIAAGETWTSVDYPRNSTVTLTEVTPTAPETVTWADPEFSQESFTVTGGQLTKITLTNQATLREGAFAVAKAFVGDGADLVPEDATFTVDYSYPAGAGYEAGSGTLTLPADGSAVESPKLPMGAEVTLTEVTPEAVEGAEWGEATFSPETVTIGGEETIAITLTNAITVTPTPTATPTPSSTPTASSTPAPTSTPTAASSALPNTGGPDPLPILIVGAALLATGIGVRLFARRA